MTAHPDLSALHAYFSGLQGRLGRTRDLRAHDLGQKLQSVIERQPFYFGILIKKTAGGLGNNAEAKSQSLSMDEQIETLKKLKELLDAGILTQEEFDKKKSEVMGI